MNEKKTIGFIAVLAAIGLLSLISQGMFFWVYGLARAVMSGFSPGKVYFLLAWFAFTAIAGLFASKHREKIKFKSRQIFSVLALLAFIGLMLGVFQFNSFIQENSIPGNAFASYIKEENYSNWELSRIQHNHLPKATIYSIEKTLGIGIGGSFDNGQPMHSIQSNPELYSIAYALIIFGILVSTILLIGKVFENTSFFGFALISFIGAASIVRVIDGGLFTSETGFLILAFGFAFVRFYPIEWKHKNILPLLGMCLWSFADVLFIAQAKAVYPNALILVFGLLFYFFHGTTIKKIREKIMPVQSGNPFRKMPLLEICLGLLLLLSIFPSMQIIQDQGFGRKLIEPEFLPSYREEGVGLYIYGLDAGVGEKDLREALQKHGKVIELEKEGWNAYARIRPFAEIYSMELEKDLREKLNKEGYFYAEENAPILAQNTFEIKWLEEPENAENCISENFLDCKVLEKDHSGNITRIRIECKTYVNWQMLALLTNIRENRCMQKLIAYQV